MEELRAAGSGVRAGSVTVVAGGLLILLISGCGETLRGKRVITPQDQQTLERCYADAHQASKGVAPQITQEDRQAVGQLLSYRGQTVEKACELIQASFKDQQCAKTVTLVALADDPDYCDAPFADRKSVEMDNSTRQDIEQRINVRERRALEGIP